MIGYRKVVVSLAYLGCSTYVIRLALAAGLAADDVLKLVVGLGSGLALYVWGNLRGKPSPPAGPDA